MAASAAAAATPNDNQQQEQEFNKLQKQYTRQASLDVQALKLGSSAKMMFD